MGDFRGPMKILQETGRTKADAVILAQEGDQRSRVSVASYWLYIQTSPS